LTSCDDPKPNNATIDFTGLNVNYESSVWVNAGGSIPADLEAKVDGVPTNEVNWDITLDGQSGFSPATFTYNQTTHKIEWIGGFWGNYYNLLVKVSLKDHPEVTKTKYTKVTFSAGFGLKGYGNQFTVPSGATSLSVTGAQFYRGKNGVETTVVSGSYSNISCSSPEGQNLGVIDPISFAPGSTHNSTTFTINWQTPAISTHTYVIYGNLVLSPLTGENITSMFMWTISCN
jgi:hypothetical protein